MASAATGVPATAASPPNSAVRRSVSGTAKAAATPKAASRNPIRRRECLILTIIACCFEPWAKVRWKSTYQSQVVWMVLDSVVNSRDKDFFISKQQKTKPYCDMCDILKGDAFQFLHFAVP